MRRLRSRGPRDTSAQGPLLQRRRVHVAIELEVQPGRNRLDWQVVVPERNGVEKSCAPDVGLVVELDKAVLHPNAHTAGNLVFEPDARGPSVAPVIETEPVEQGRVVARRVDLRASPSTL